MSDQGILDFGEQAKRRGKSPKGLEVHEHCIISGRRANRSDSKIVHSHEGGDTQHEHPDCGPASYTIDKDEWFRATGLRGGGRKRFTKTPEGEQLPRVERAPGADEFEIHVGPNPPGWDPKSSGGGYFTAVRMIQACKMTVSKVVPFDPTPRKTRAAAPT